MTPVRIAVGGWQHETNTFAPIKADYNTFEQGDEWPAMGFGKKMLELVDGVHLPITGAVQALADAGQKPVPLMWCSATPCAHVTRHAFEKICERFLTLIDRSMPLDGIYLDLHGAMVCEHLQDGEGEFLRRVRDHVGERIPIVVSLDLHANITPMMVQMATLLDVYRTYPHVDMGETGYRAASHLLKLLDTGERWYPSYRQIDFLLALNWGCTLIEPCRSIYDALPDFMGGEVVSLSFACGFHLSDIHDIGPSVVAYGRTQQAADNAARMLAERVILERRRFHEKFWPADEGVARALELVGGEGKTVVLADTQDNPGGGGTGDTTGLLQALIDHQAENAVFGVLSDPQTVSAAVSAGIGNRFDAMLGGKSGIPGQRPLNTQATVVGLTDGKFTATGPMYRGARMCLGPCALLDIQGVKVVVASKAVQTADQSIFRHVGIEPENMSLLALKSSVHFRNDFSDLADEILIICAPGVVYANPAALQYHNIRSGIEIIEDSA